MPDLSFQHFWKRLICILFVVVATHQTSAQSYSLQECIDILDSLYYEPDPGDLSILRSSTNFHIQNSDNDSLLAILHEYWAYFAENQYQYDTALIHYEKAGELFLKINDSLKAAYMIYGEASMLTELQEHVLSTQRYLETLNYYKEVGTEEDFADTYNAMANNYYYAGDENIAINYYKKALSHYLKHENLEQISMIYGNIASAFNQIEKYDSALYYYQKTVALLLDSEYIDLLAGTYHGIGITKENIEEYDDAYYYYRRAFELSKNSDYRDLFGFSNQYLGYYHLSQKNYDSAIFYARIAEQIGVETGVYLLKYNSYDLLNQIYSEIGNHRMAYQYLKHLKEEDDSLFTINKSRQINIMSKEYEAATAEKALLEKDLELERYRSTLKYEQSWQTIMVVALIAMFVVVVLVLRNVRIKSKSNVLLQNKNREILAKNEQIKRIEEAKSKWFINVSHELRTPLSLVKGPLQQIARVEKLEGNSKSLINIANRNISHLEQLIAEILDLSKLETGSIIIRPEAFDLVASVRHWLEPFESALKSRKLVLQVHPSEEIIITKLDKNQFKKVMVNLINNSIKYTEDEGKIDIHIKAKGQDLELVVEDTGVGIARNEQPYIFDRFYQASNFSQTEEQGSGVGLAMSKEIIELHKGIIQVKSDPGVGTRMIVKIPRAIMEVGLITENEFSSEDQVKYKAPNILLVEDNPDMIDFVNSFLDKRFDVVKKSNAQDALESIEEKQPDLIITDLMMPKMDGFHFIQKLKDHTQYKHIPIIVISAISDELKRLALLRLGINDYMVKPFNPEELVIKVENLLNIQIIKKEETIDATEEDISFEDRLVKELEQKVREFMSDQEFNVTRLAEEASLSERQLYRYLRQTTKMTPANFIKEIRLQRAFELARRSVYATTAELAYAVGFQHPSYFTTVFKKRFGKKPSDYMKDKLS